MSADDTTASTTVASATGLNFALAASTRYSFEYDILFQSAATNTGIGLAMTGPASPTLISYTVQIPNGADSTFALFNGWGTAYDDAVVGTAVEAANTTYLAKITGVIQTGATAGTLTPRFRTSRAGTTITLKSGSWGALFTP